MYRKARAAVVVGACTLAACAPRATVTSGVAPAVATGGALLRVVETKSGRDVSFGELARAVAGNDVVFFGEMHDDAVTHAAEVAVLAAIAARHDKVVLSLEMFERDVQGELDRYLAGAIAEKDFLAASRPWDRYATDYRPLVEMARLRGWPVVASNVPRRLASAVSRQGLAVLDTLGASDRALVARDNQCPRDDYHRRFVQAMGGDAGHGGAPSGGATNAVDRYYEAQCVKDETMAEAIVQAYSTSGKGTVLLHVNGAFHSDHRLGTVARVKRRLPNARLLVITAIPQAASSRVNVDEHRDKADYVLVTRR